MDGHELDENGERIFSGGRWIGRGSRGWEVDEDGGLIVGARRWIGRWGGRGCCLHTPRKLGKGTKRRKDASLIEKKSLQHSYPLPFFKVN